MSDSITRREALRLMGADDLDGPSAAAIADRFEARAHRCWLLADQAAADPRRGSYEAGQLNRAGDQYASAADLIREELDR